LQRLSGTIAPITGQANEQCAVAGERQVAAVQA